jgi:glycosylphosphatidylinositol transamidase (GPIT) subunit GPI8
MKLYLSKTHSDEEESFADEGKLGILYSSREDLIKLCDFFDNIRNELSKQDNIHMHFRDSFDNWSRENHIDIEVNVEQ